MLVGGTFFLSIFLRKNCINKTVAQHTFPSMPSPILLVVGHLWRHASTALMPDTLVPSLPRNAPLVSTLVHRWTMLFCETSVLGHRDSHAARTCGSDNPCLATTHRLMTSHKKGVGDGPLGPSPSFFVRCVPPLGVWCRKGARARRFRAGWRIVPNRTA